MKLRAKILAGIAAVLAVVCIVVWADDDITVAASWTYSAGGRKRALPSTTKVYPIGTNTVIESVQSIGTTAEALVLGDVTNPGFCWFRNLDLTNYVEIGSVTDSVFVAFMRLNTNQFSIGWIGCTAPYARANTAAVKLDYVIADR